MLYVCYICVYLCNICNKGYMLKILLVNVNTSMLQMQKYNPSKCDSYHLTMQFHACLFTQIKYDSNARFVVREQIPS